MEFMSTMFVTFCVNPIIRELTFSRPCIMADEGEGDSEVLMRIRDQAGAFEHRQDFSDEKVNDGRNYAGLMQAADYKKRRIEVLEDPEEKKREAIAAARDADRSARARETQEREEREAARRAKLKAALAEAEESETVDDNQEAEGGKAKKKKKKKGGPSSSLSFEVED